MIGVLIFHATYFQGAEGLWGRIALTLPSFMWSGLDLFFLLSGFLITRILIKHKDATNYFKVFYIRRVARIFPLYYFLLFVCFLVVPMFDTGRWNDFWTMPDRGNPWYYWLYVSNWMNAFDGNFRHHFLSVTWSLSVEEQFYLIWPLVVYRLRTATLGRVCMGLVITAFVLRTVGVLNGWNPLAIYVLTPMRMDTLLMGGWIAVRAHQDGGFERLFALARRVGPIAILVSLSIALGHQIDPTWMMPVPNKLLIHPLMQTVGFTTDVLAYGSLLVWLMVSKPGGGVRRFFESGFLVAYGKYSYSIYLVHLPVIFFWTFNVQSPADESMPFVLRQLGRYVFIMIMPMLVAQATWRVIEEPVLNLRRYFPYDHGPRSGAGHGERAKA